MWFPPALLFLTLDAFAPGSVFATLFPAPVKTSSGLCRGEALTLALDGNTWSTVGEPTKYVIPTKQAVQYCATRGAAAHRIRLEGTLSDNALLAIVGAVRKGRLIPEDSPKTVELPDGSVASSVSCCRFQRVDTGNSISVIIVETSTKVRVSTSRRPGAGQELKLRKIRGRWFVVDVAEWVA